VNGERPVVAAFDVDGTLTQRDCVRPFLELVGGRRGLVMACARTPVRSAGAVLRLDRDRLKELVVGGVLRGRRVDDVESLGRQFATVVRETMMRMDTLARLDWHRCNGHRVVLVSASLRPYLDPLGELLGVDAVLCTDGEVIDGLYTASLAGGNCRASEKATRLCRWMDDHDLVGAEVWAYGDSRGDRELLECAHHPVWVAGTTVRAVPLEVDP
jgi:phosphatidylglycerophosphatase C